jgi:formate-dependent nitrite reductase membrane component NrfD
VGEEDKGMIQSRPYEFMVEYTPQREWVEGRGALLWLAFFFIELGAGTFLVSSLFENWSGMLVGWTLCAFLGGGFHLLYLGHPLRFWRMLISSGWKTSWISRGIYFVSLFLIFGGIYWLVSWHGSAPGWLLFVADLFAFCTVVYGGFAMNFVNGIQLWNTPLLPVLYAVLGIWGGLGLNLILLTGGGAWSHVSRVEEWSRVFLLAFAFVVFIYLLSIRYQGAAARVSVRRMVAGKWAYLFWPLVVVLGIAFPMAVVLGSWLARVEIPAGLLHGTIIFELVGDLAFRYCLLRCGLYAPLLPSRGYALRARDGS